MEARLVDAQINVSPDGWSQHFGIAQAANLRAYDYLSETALNGFYTHQFADYDIGRGGSPGMGPVLVGLALVVLPERIILYQLRSEVEQRRDRA